MFARGGGRRHYLDSPIQWGATDGAELEKFERQRASVWDVPAIFSAINW